MLWRMKINVFQIQARDELEKIYAVVSFHDSDGPPHNSCDVRDFIEPTDSYAEIRKRAIEAARRHLEKALAAAPIESPDL